MFSIYYNHSNNSNSKITGAIYLYKNSSNDYIKLYGKHLEEIYNWYNNKRWIIGCEGNTLFIRNVKSQNNNNPEGAYSSSGKT